jgi:dihydrofolate reductase
MKTVLIAAITVDGFIGRTSDHFPDWTGKADKKLFVDVTKQMGVMVMGSRTFATIGRALPGRRTIVYTTRPESVTAEGVETTNETPRTLIARLEEEGAPGLAICGGATVYGMFMAARVVDEVYLTVAPKIFGRGVRLWDEELDYTLKLIESKKLDDNNILLHYRVLNGEATAPQ